jgi:hypothetical protein
MHAVQTVEPRSGAILIQQHGLDGQGGMSLAEIGRARGLSRERVRQIAERATEQLRGNTILQAIAAEDVRTAKASPAHRDRKSPSAQRGEEGVYGVQGKLCDML